MRWCFAFFILSLCVIVVTGGRKQWKSKVSDSCSTRWFKIYENSADGRTLFGNRESLKRVIARGADVKVVIPSWNAQLRLQNLKILGYHTCGQSLFNLGTEDFQTLAINATWRFNLFCTTGDVDISSWFVGKHERASDVRLNVGIQWFIRFSSIRKPIIKFDRNGNVLQGSINATKQAIVKGADLRVVRRSGRGWYSAHFDNVEIDNSVDPATVAGLSIWHVSQRRKGDHYVFNNNAYWRMALWASNGGLDQIKWLVGRHKSPGRKFVQTKQTWYADPCWELAYSYDEKGNPIKGSFDFLRNALESGHRTKVVFGNNPYMNRQSIEPDLVILFGKMVNNVEQLQILGMFINNISKEHVDRIADDTFWYWQVYIRVNGIVTVYQWDVGRHKNRGIFGFNTSATWYIDTRSWTRQFANDGQGNVVFGSKQNLINQIQQGADIRLKFNLPVTPPATFETVFITPDNLNITVDSGETQISSIHVRAVDNSPKDKPNSTVWWFSMATTSGKLDVSRWTVGRFQDRNHNSFRVNMDWFSNP